jgi:hypothetical protein
MSPERGATIISDLQTKTLRSLVTCPRSHSQEMVEQDLEPRPSGSTQGSTAWIQTQACWPFSVTSDFEKVTSEVWRLPVCESGQQDLISSDPSPGNLAPTLASVGKVALWVWLQGSGTAGCQFLLLSRLGLSRDPTPLPEVFSSLRNLSPSGPHVLHVGLSGPWRAPF